MGENIVVTIRCLVYNHEQYLQDCLEGFVRQKTNFPFEAIVHDDASTDGSAAIIREYAKKYPDIIKPVIERENQYSKHDGSLRKIMDSYTRGKYVAYCEGDDYWIDPLKLQKQVNFLESHPDYYVVGGRSLMYLQAEKKIVLYPYSLHLRTSFMPRDYVRNILMHTSTFLFRSKSLIECPSSDNVLQSDIFLILHTSNHGVLKLKVLKDIMSVYRIHTGGITKSKIHTNVMKSVSSMCEILKSYDSYSNYIDHKVVTYKMSRENFLMNIRTSNFFECLLLCSKNIFLCIKILQNYVERFLVVRILTLFEYRKLGKLNK